MLLNTTSTVIILRNETIKILNTLMSSSTTETCSFNKNKNIECSYNQYKCITCKVLLFCRHHLIQVWGFSFPDFQGGSESNSITLLPKQYKNTYELNWNCKHLTYILLTGWSIKHFVALSYEILQQVLMAFVIQLHFSTFCPVNIFTLKLINDSLN